MLLRARRWRPKGIEEAKTQPPQYPALPAPNGQGTACCAAHPGRQPIHRPLRAGAGDQEAGARVALSFHRQAGSESDFD